MKSEETEAAFGALVQQSIRPGEIVNVDAVEVSGRVIQSRAAVDSSYTGNEDRGY